MDEDITIMIRNILAVHLHHFNHFSANFVVPTVRFEMLNYTVEENSESVEAVLILSNPSSIHSIVHVITTDGSATGKLHIALLTTFQVYYRRC